MAMCVLILSSCGDDDDEFSSKSIIGTWRDKEMWEDYAEIYDYTFKKDNSFSAKEISNLAGEKYEGSGSGKYYVNGTNVLLVYDVLKGIVKEEYWTIIYFDGKQMKVTKTLTYEKEMEDYTYTKTYFKL